MSKIRVSLALDKQVVKVQKKPAENQTAFLLHLALESSLMYF